MNIENSFDKRHVEKIFIHELGHYVANNFIYKLNGLSKSERIIFYPCENELCGHLEVETPLDIEERVPPKERLHYFIGKKIMGCIFQSYLMHSELFDCFNSNGKFDFGDIENGINVNLLKWLKREEIVELEELFLSDLKSHLALEFLRSIYNKDLFLFNEIEKKWHLDLNKLNAELYEHDFSIFNQLFSKFLFMLEEIINS